jgi:hypothetical protein
MTAPDRPDPFERIVIWHSPDHDPAQDADRPLYAFDYADLLAHARASLDRRERAYPEMVEKKRLAADLARRDIEAWRLLVAEWTWIACGPEAAGAALPPRESLFDRIAAVDLGIERVGQELQRGRRDYDNYRQAHMLHALRWHLSRLRLGEPEVHYCQRLTRELRAEKAAARAKAA